jgi:hypothetical protein
LVKISQTQNLKIGIGEAVFFNPYSFTPTTGFPVNLWVQLNI